MVRIAKIPEVSAGILLFRRTGPEPEVLLVHPGGPFWAKKDEGVWSIPKGLVNPGEDPLAAAHREFTEETGATPAGDFIPLGSVRLPSGKTVIAWALAGDLDLTEFHSNSFKMEWPPKSGRLQEFPEADRANWFRIEEAERKINKGQKPLLARLADHFAAPHR